MENQNSSYSVQIGKTTFIVCVKQSETAKKPIEKMFKDRTMRFDSKEFGGRIRDLRKKKGITQEQLSIMLNVSANHLAKVETGSRCCSIELLQDLSSCLNVRTDYLLNGDAPHNNHLRERLTFLAQELEKITADLPVWG